MTRSEAILTAIRAVLEAPQQMTKPKRRQVMLYPTNSFREWINGRLSLAAIEKHLREEGYDQAAIDGALDFVIKAREHQEEE